MHQAPSSGRPLRPYYSVVVRKPPRFKTRAGAALGEIRDALSALILRRIYVDEAPPDDSSDQPWSIILT